MYEKHLSVLTSITAFSKCVSGVLIFSLLPLVALAADTSSDSTASALNLKRKIAIARFTNETQSGNTFLVSASGGAGKGCHRQLYVWCRSIHCSSADRQRIK